VAQVVGEALDSISSITKQITKIKQKQNKTKNDKLMKRAKNNGK
jgi:hypothetical protein